MDGLECVIFSEVKQTKPISCEITNRWTLIEMIEPTEQK